CLDAFPTRRSSELHTGRYYGHNFSLPRYPAGAFAALPAPAGALLEVPMSDSLFKLETRYTPAGDQPEAIRQMVEGLEAGLSHQTLLGVTGSGKTFSIANVIAQVQRPTMVLAPNKTLAAQLYGEFKAFFPHNAVE